MKGIAVVRIRDNWLPREYSGYGAVAAVQWRPLARIPLSAAPPRKLFPTRYYPQRRPLVEKAVNKQL
jgi:hypothetical protein